MKTLKKFFPIIMVVIMLFGMVAAAPASAAGAVTGCKQWHVVQKGDTLSEIAKLYNTTWQELAEINELENPNLIYIGQSICVATDGSNTTTTPPTLPNTGAGIRIYATSVKEDDTVTLQGKFLAGNTSYTIYLSNMKANHPTDYLLTTITTASDGSFNRTYTIPTQLHDVSVIKVIVVNSKGDTASNWFYNLTSNSNVGGIGSPALNFTVETVKKGKTVKLQVNNLIPNLTYDIIIGKSLLEGKEGTVVGTVSSAKGGSMVVTIEIPADIADRAKLDLMIVNNPYDISAFQTFENK